MTEWIELCAVAGLCLYVDLHPTLTSAIALNNDPLLVRKVVGTADISRFSAGQVGSQILSIIGSNLNVNQQLAYQVTHGTAFFAKVKASYQYVNF